ncbi:DUF3304 domain-containing protein [Ralstonia solanacearum]|uniref:DUF3304 domain-containing protein n=1 Tax=Ralstonia solanacearum TaxID=305 RepID=UPI0007C9630B|nr:DUF3304 domain-containing protein [Ralstonia solanacearum]
MNAWKVFRAAVAALAALSVLVACSKKDDIPDNKATASITSYNHTPDYIHQFYVDDAGGGNSFAYGGGGSFVCCVIYPTVWYPGLKATVKWTTSSSDPNATGDAAQEHWHEAVVPIEKYTEPGTLNVHFLPGGKVRLIISNMGAGHPNYPGPDYPVAPPDFHFEPWKGAASVVEAYKRRHGLEGGDYSKVLSDEPASAPSLPKNVKLPPPPIIPEDEK